MIQSCSGSLATLKVHAHLGEAARREEKFIFAFHKVCLQLNDRAHTYTRRGENARQLTLEKFHDQLGVVFLTASRKCA